MAVEQDPENAFVELFELAPTGEGGLSGLSFGLKDLFDVAGRVTGSGSPVWAQTHDPATAHAPALARLLEAGARCVGKTHTDELAFSLMGANAHYGTPTNPAAPDRVPGGSSSGSASVAAAGRVDFAIGSDTGGSVRLPASFCGLYGLRTTHGEIGLSGATPLAPSFDAIGWFARDLERMDQVAAAYGLPPADPRGATLKAPRDLWDLAEPDTVAAARQALGRFEARYGVADPAPLAPTSSGFADWREAFRICQGYEAWRSHGAWIEAHEPGFGPGVRERFAFAKTVTPEQYASASAARMSIASQMAAFIGEDAVLAFPTAPGPAPLLAAPEASLDGFRTRALALLCPAGLARAPQLSVPAGLVSGAPVGLSLLGPSLSDRRLIAMAARVG